MDKEIQTSNQNSVKGIRAISKQINPADFTRSNCKFCCSSFRHEAEEQFARHGNTIAIVKFLKEKGESISDSSIRNHLRYHFGRKEFEERIKEFSDEMDRWSSFRPTKEQRLQEFIDLCYRRIQILESHIDSTDSVDRTKMSETVIKLIEQSNKCQIELDKGREQSDLVYIFMDRFASIVKMHIESNTSREVSQILGAALVSILDEVQKMIGDLPKND